MSDEPFHLSVVATSRNDNHGKNLLYRMQAFVDGFIEQCKRHDLKAELILVEWNPPGETPSLAQALHIPKDKGPCQIRIIRVPPEVHLKLGHATHIPLFQMIGKNVGIRRALGKFVLATNIDILFSDKIFQFMKHRLSQGYLYRVDRLDVPEKLPETNSFDEILSFCSRHFFRVNGRIGTKLVNHNPVRKKIAQKLRDLRLHISLRPVLRALPLFFHQILHLSLMSLFKKTQYFAVFIRRLVLRILKKVCKKLLCFVYPDNSIILHTNACGDFTLLSSQDWKHLKGYPEWNIFSWHLDSILLYQAKQHGIKQRSLPNKMPIFHIEHEVGSGYSPEGAHQLFQRLELKGIPYLSNSDLKKLVLELNHSPTKVIYNDENWGMADIELEEIIV